MIALDPREPIEYTPRHGDGEVFLLRPMTPALELKIKRKINEANTTDTELLRLGLVGWRDYKDATGADAVFESDSNGLPTDDTLTRIPTSGRAELATAFLRSGQLTEDDKKNLR